MDIEVGLERDPTIFQQHSFLSLMYRLVQLKEGGQGPVAFLLPGLRDAAFVSGILAVALVCVSCPPCPSKSA